ncbi:MAG: hypothetical protein JEY79_18890 [Pseudodesulfovibrio sp.]|nr:hypothetical protein [Pseudodesulfovibrio sp.]
MKFNTQQLFHVQAVNGNDCRTCKSMTKAWREGELRSLLHSVGFGEVINHVDWPNSGGAFMLLTASKQ